MRVFKKSGTKERLFEMFENVNKVKLNENAITNELDVNNGVVQGLLDYLKNNSISDTEELDLGGNGMIMFYTIEATDWNDTPYRSATRMQPEEGGYPENIKGALTNVVIMDADNNEYHLSNEALDAINSVVSFDGKAYEVLELKASNSGSDEYSRADFDRDDRLSNEGVNDKL